MKTNLIHQLLRRAMQAGLCASLAVSLTQAQDKPAEVKPKPDFAKPEKPAKPAFKKVPFLGLVLSPLDEALAAQIDLPEGIGMVVRAVMPNSPAAAAGLQQHDVLHYFNDQLLINESQLVTLVRQAGTGTEVTLKILRKGKPEQVSIKVGEHEEREPADILRYRHHGYGERGPDSSRPSGLSKFPEDGRMFSMPLNSEGFAHEMRQLSERIKELEGKPEEMREEIARFQKQMQERTKGLQERTRELQNLEERTQEFKKKVEESRARTDARNSKDAEGGIRVQVTNEGTPGTDGSGVVTATADGKGNVTVTQTNSTRTSWSDSDGSGELVVENGKKRLTVKDREGKEVFSGPVNSEEERKGLPTDVRKRLERIESNVKVEAHSEAKAGEL